MANITITALDPESSLYGGDHIFEDALVHFAGEDTYAPGTILARRHTAADSYVGVITGTGTRVATMTAPDGKLKAGAYSLLAESLTSGAGRWKMTDPDGQVAQYTTLAAGDNLFFDSLGVFVDIADSGTAYVTNDTVAFTVVTASGYRLFAVGGANGSGVPAAVLAHELYKSGSGTLNTKVCVGGKFRKHKLIIDADGDADNLTADHIDQLRQRGIYVLTVQDLSVLDNS